MHIRTREPLIATTDFRAACPAGQEGPAEILQSTIYQRLSWRIQRLLATCEVAASDYAVAIAQQLLPEIRASGQRRGTCQFISGGTGRRSAIPDIALTSPAISREQEDQGEEY